MSLTRTKYGVEFDPEREDEGSSGIGWAVVAVLLVAAVSFVVTVVHRISGDGEAEQGDDAPLVVSAPPPVSPPAADTPRPVPPPPDVAPIEVCDLGSRSPKVRSLLLRLEEATKQGDLAMQVSTIETIRGLPGEAAADMDAELVPRLGRLNWSWLFDLGNPQWTAEVVVKRGDSATRIAQEHGSTLASFKKLNGLDDANHLVVGRKVKVMNHPRFNIVVHKRLGSVDLFLNGKLFKRYQLPESAPAPQCEPGAYRTPANLTEFFRKMGVALGQADVAELDMMVPRDTPLNVSAQ